MKPLTARSSCLFHVPNFKYLIALVDLVVVLHRYRCIILYTHAVEFCNIRKGGGICPTGNSCCPYDAESIQHYSTTTLYLSACIPNDLGSYNATCCHDDHDVLDSTKGSSYMTGCPVGYTCAMDQYSKFHIDGYTRHPFCLANETFNIDPLLPVLPRYPIYPCPQIENVYGFSMNTDNNKNNTLDMKLAYYSSHGDIQQLTTATTANWKDSIRYVVIMIHGANRNADDYFCSIHAILHKQQQQQIHSSEVLLIVPWFLATTDNPMIPLVNGGTPYRWDSRNDISGPWRYGANAFAPSSETAETSSFALLDRIVSFLLDPSDPPNFPSMQRLVVAGHSSGGQFVQRWSMLTSIWDEQRMKSIVANPSSYAYLTPMRHVDKEWRLPNHDEKLLCPDYDDWEWGIGSTLLRLTSTVLNRSSSIRSTILSPYVQDALNRYGSLWNVTSIFSTRDVSYLAGGLDVCNKPDTNKPNDWCNSHGLETSCRDMIQGSNRLERHHWYCVSLQLLNISHQCIVVPYVGHDHALMFSSDIGATALFGSDNLTNKFGMKIERSTRKN